jgi:polysaccharide deacetylase family protein (PEP-CTERM system associated)
VKEPARRRGVEVRACGGPVTNALTVDVEEYYHALVFQDGVRHLTPRSWPSRVEGSTARVLELLGAADVRATFFTVGEVAEAHPALLRKIAGDGHEVACHSYRHVPVSRQTREEFREDVRRAKGVLEDLTGQPVYGFRAPNFSIGPAEVWAYDVLLREGFRYDSSVYPIHHDRYGDPTAPRRPYWIECGGQGRLLEFPVGTVRVLGWNWPIGGGGYFRLLPYALSRWGIRRVNRLERRGIAFYFHPWELDPEQPRPPMPWRQRARHYVGMRKEADKLARLLREVPFTTARVALGL